MKRQTNTSFPQNICLELFTSLHTPEIPSENDVLNAITQIKDPRNRDILMAVYQDRKTLESIGKSIGLTKERVRQRRNLALWEIRRILFPPPKRLNPDDLPILPETNPLRDYNIPFEQAICLTGAKCHVLRTHGYYTIADICKSSPNELSKLKGFGRRSANVIIDEIHALDKARTLTNNIQPIYSYVHDLPDAMIQRLARYGFGTMKDFSKMTPKRAGKCEVFGIPKRVFTQIQQTLETMKG